ncbi:hypothetical protein A7H1H_0499 [Aliarcobacter butzleri 7h1h]|uniref:hypothetical protein n=1 Tax=Aliarcobacter butzleri TaxID=28197 RepID=UPI0002F10C08|nr:hypothetical protein [Aliarcobacter butzleri]AGR76822.1 hypothetical protein A7H1H_0499 [Aliarcobacter butzleri 7h1h]KLE07386.1 hypothetical protein AF79_11195 [Aliarcobacter butzleri L354]MCG3651050.1 hypothetical protein [Aliarcobacter butzleri]MDN5067467.1 hypothetical protein [Aliarcobacter butzleri]MDN5072070.1 hypothetical protein [Aliarcobacter butzleri]
MDDKNKMRISDYVVNGMMFISIAIWSYIFIFIWGKAVIILLDDKDYATLGLLFILTGIVIIIYGYWMKYVVSYRNPNVIEFYKRLRKKQELNEKLIFHERALVWVDNGYLVKTCNRIGLLFILAGAIIFIVVANIL